MSSRKIIIEIDRSDIVMLEVAVEERMKTWKRTREYWEKVEENEGFDEVYVEGEIEEANSLHEAENMIQLWEDFSKTILNQIQ